MRAHIFTTSRAEVPFAIFLSIDENENFVEIWSSQRVVFLVEMSLAKSRYYLRRFQLSKIPFIDDKWRRQSYFSTQH